MSVWQLPQEAASWLLPFTLCLDARQRERFVSLIVGLLFARGRRTVTSWIRAGGLSDDFRACYHLVAVIGRRAQRLATELLIRVVLPRLAKKHDRLLFALDDTPTRRYGPCVEGAGVHHNPTPGPAQQEFVYGHVWVTLAWLAQHPWWGVIALPLRACLYIRQKDVEKLPPDYKWPFRTKLAMAVELIEWLAVWTHWWQKPVWLVCDGAYATREVLKAASAAGVTIVSRLRRDAALLTLPPEQPKGKRGRKRIYGLQRISLAKRAGQQRGWTRGEFVLYGERVTKTFKTFLATWRPAGGVIRVVLVREEDRSWRAYFSTDPEASVANILEAVADRFAIEQCFHDLKEVWGAGQQQVRHVWASVGAYHLCLWLHTLVEVWAWNRPEKRLVDRRASPWDNQPRRPSHADRRKALQRQCVQEQYQAAARGKGQASKFRALAKGLLHLVG